MIFNDFSRLLRNHLKSRMKEGIIMIQTTVKAGACTMCEAHINDASCIFCEKVSSSHTKGETIILSKEPLAGRIS